MSGSDAWRASSTPRLFAEGAPLLATALLLTGCGGSGGGSGALVVVDAWSRPVAIAVDDTVTTVTPGADPTGSVAGVVYLSLTNNTDEERQLVGLSTPVAPRAELHETRLDGDIARMRAVERIRVPAGETVHLRPGGLHAMLVGVVRELRPGDRFPLSLFFDDGDSLSLTVEVRRR